jgi:ubiquinone/menaquinone biosynthesis C-methylase UbiE
MRIRAEILSCYLARYLPENCSILDIGGGQGLITNLLAKKLHARAVNTDVINYSLDASCISCQKDQLPFSKHQFDYSLLIDVLHHAQNPEKLLKEAKRVTRNKIIVLENRNPSSHKFFSLITWFLDATQTFFFGIPLPKTLPLSFWRRTFRRLRLKIELDVSTKGQIPFINQRLFILLKT